MFLFAKLFRPEKGEKTFPSSSQAAIPPRHTVKVFQFFRSSGKYRSKVFEYREIGNRFRVSRFSCWRAIHLTIENQILTVELQRQKQIFGKLILNGNTSENFFVQCGCEK